MATVETCQEQNRSTKKKQNRFRTASRETGYNSNPGSTPNSKMIEISGFQVLIDRLCHFEHVHFFPAKHRLQFVVGDDFAFVLRIL